MRSLREARGRLLFGLRFRHLVREKKRFSLRTAIRTASPSRYHLATSEKIWIRHSNSDVFALIEVFEHDVYELPSQMLKEIQETVTGPVQVLDLGGHVGTFAIWAFRLISPAPLIVSIEAAPSTAELLGRAQRSHRHRDRWTVLHAAAGNHSGTAHFEDIGGTNSALRSMPTTGAVDVPVVDVIPIMQEANLVKMDVEGAEWSILEDNRLLASAPRHLIVEFHDNGHEDWFITGQTRLLELGYVIHEIRDNVAFASRARAA